MRVVRSSGEMQPALGSAADEAIKAFGDGALYMEKLVERARHIEVQVLGDADGNVVHVGERECSTQRRYQKLIEEAPSPIVDTALRQALGEAAVKLARAVDYVGAGTVEFVLDEDTGRYYFLEMNTRIQVEHPVTEMVAGCDLVAEQIRVASGERISFAQSDLKVNGHAIECRINAEDPARRFLPSPGRIAEWAPPSGDGIRVDTHCHAGYTVTPFYDSLLAKVIVHAPTRAAAIERMRRALRRFVVSGVKTTIPFHLSVLDHEDFHRGRVTTRWVEETLRPGN
jgi:acetyl-CoA carboxylase biotin carboxylase subunit